MTSKLYTSRASAETIDRVHEMLGLRNSYYLVARLAFSIGLSHNRGSRAMDGIPQQDSTGKEFNEYTLLNDSDGYKTAIRSILQIEYLGHKNEEGMFGGQGIMKKLIDEGCSILEGILRESHGDKDVFLKKLYSIQYDQSFRENVYKFPGNGEIIETRKDDVDNDEREFIDEMVRKTQEFLLNFNYEVKEVTHSLSSAVLRIKVKLPLGKSISLIYSKEDDLKLHLGTNSSIIIAPISGYLCFDIQRSKREIVHLNDIINRIEYSSPVKFPLGLNVDNEVIGLDLSDANTPHILIAGSTGQGKSECLKSIIGTLISKNSSEDLKLILIDPKKVEFSRFRSIPHLSREIITEIEDAIVVLEEAVIEMNKRYDLLRDYEVNNIDKYNEISPSRLPHLIIIFDEFADFILSSKVSKERIEASIMKLSGKARASGIHLVLSTQRPDKDIVTGVIKANLPAKIAFKTSTASNSQIIIDSTSANQLFGKGDMFLSKEGVLIRIQGAFIGDSDLNDYILAAR